ncbi:MAG: hypothetical protein WCI75_17325, partial [candidate division NC10 bacterium]
MHTIETSRSSSCRPWSVVVLALAVAVVLVLLLFVAQALAGELDAVAILVPDGGRIVQEGQRVDVYGAKSRRTAYEYQRGDGRTDIYNLDGTRRRLSRRCGTWGNTRHA